MEQEITKKDMDFKLKFSKGWEIQQTANEYVYDFHLTTTPIIVKVLSGICVNNNNPKNKGSEVIRVFAVLKDKISKKRYKIIKGLVKKEIVFKTQDWEENLEKAVYKMIRIAKMRYSSTFQKNNL